MPLIWVGCTGLLFAIFAHPITAPVDVDEIYWIGSAYYFELEISRGQAAHSDWKLLPARENPPVAKYCIGLGLAMAGQHVMTPDILGAFYAIYKNIPGAWGMGESYTDRAAVVARMSPELQQQVFHSSGVELDPALRTPARLVMVICAAGASFVVFIFGRMLRGDLAGLLASQIILIHPAVMYAYNHAMSDAVAMLFATASAAATFWVVRDVLNSKQTRPLRLGLIGCAAGVLLGLACGAKMNSLVIGMLVLIAPSFTWQSRINSDSRKAMAIAACSLIMCSCGMLVFAGLNPTILQSPWNGFIETVTLHRQTESIQAQFLAGHLITFAQKFAAVGRLVAFHPLGFGLLLLLAGLQIGSRRLEGRFLATWMLVAVICVTVWIPFSMDRYVIPIIVPASLVVACLTIDIAAWIWTSCRFTTRHIGAPGVE